MRRWIYVALMLSLCLNLLLLGGFMYQRFMVQPRQLEAWAVQQLHLHEDQREELKLMHDWTRDRIRQALREMQPEIAKVRQGLRGRNANDPGVREAMRKLADRRFDLQMEALERVMAFRDTLEPDQRQKFNQLTERPGFVLRLLGLGSREGGQADSD